MENVGKLLMAGCCQVAADALQSHTANAEVAEPLLQFINVVAFDHEGRVVFGQGTNCCEMIVRTLSTLIEHPHVVSCEKELVAPLLSFTLHVTCPGRIQPSYRVLIAITLIHPSPTSTKTSK